MLKEEPASHWLHALESGVAHTFVACVLTVRAFVRRYVGFMRVLTQEMEMWEAPLGPFAVLESTQTAQEVPVAIVVAQEQQEQEAA